MITVVAGIVLLGVLVFFHELGHFLVAKAFGVRVLTFSIGFGPRLFGFKRGDTDYRVSAIPLGGYVRMFGDDITEEIPESEHRYSFLHQKTFPKSAIAVAGPLANFILAIVLLFFMYVGTRAGPSATIATVMPEGPAAMAGMQNGDIIKRIAGNDIRDFVDLQKEIQSRPDQKVEIEVERAGATKTLNVEVGGVFDLNPLNKGKRLGRVGVMPALQKSMVHVVDAPILKEAGIKSGDIILEIDGQPVENHSEMMAVLDSKKDLPELSLKTQRDDQKAKSITLQNLEAPLYGHPETIERNGVMAEEMPAMTNRVEETKRLLGEEVTRLQGRRGLGGYDGTIAKVLEKTVAFDLEVKEGDRAVAVDGKRVFANGTLNSTLLQKPDEIHVVGLLTQKGATRVLVFRMRGEEKRGRESFKSFGAYPADQNYGMGEMVETSIGSGEAMGIASGKFVEMFNGIFKGIWLLITGEVAMSSLGGPITIINIAGQAAKLGLDYYLRIMCFISINLGILNLLPIPVLDGGHLLMFGIEAVQRKQLSLATRERAIKVGFAFLGLLMIFVIFNDIANLVL